MSDRIWRWIAWRVPRELVKWCGYRIGAAATQGSWSTENVPGLRFVDAMKRWEGRA